MNDNKTTKWPENIFDEMNDLLKVEQKAVSLAYACNTIGLDKLSKNLYELCDKINIIRNNVKTAAANHISDDLKTAEEMSRTILKAALLKKDENTGEIVYIKFSDKIICGMIEYCIFVSSQWSYFIKGFTGCAYSESSLRSNPPELDN